MQFGYIPCAGDRSITKHDHLVMNVDNIPQIIQETFFLTTSGRRGPDLVDIPKDIRQQMAIPLWYNSCSRDQTNQRGWGNTALFSFAVVILSH